MGFLKLLKLRITPPYAPDQAHVWYHDRLATLKLDMVWTSTLPGGTVPQYLDDGTPLPTLLHLALDLGAHFELGLVGQVGVEHRLHCQARIPNLTLARAAGLDEDCVVSCVDLEQQAFPAQMLVGTRVPMDSSGATLAAALTRRDAVEPLLHQDAVRKYSHSMEGLQLSTKTVLAHIRVHFRCPACRRIRAPSAQRVLRCSATQACFVLQLLHVFSDICIRCRGDKISCRIWPGVAMHLVKRTAVPLDCDNLLASYNTNNGTKLPLGNTFIGV
mmetsp:Transcript_82576/g.232404  ORF Transcript_82576/g.232404 Transcript_82576/m.232404 type:complete len:273 (+) Transcript_82576:44-862(+)